MIIFRRNLSNRRWSPPKSFPFRPLSTLSGSIITCVNEKGTQKEEGVPLSVPYNRWKFLFLRKLHPSVGSQYSLNGDGAGISSKRIQATERTNHRLLLLFLIESVIVRDWCTPRAFGFRRFSVSLPAINLSREATRAPRESGAWKRELRTRTHMLSGASAGVLCCRRLICFLFFYEASSALP